MGMILWEITLSLTISKIFEKCIKVRMVNFLNKNAFFQINNVVLEPN
jgi:hypothetical protein